MVWFRENMYEEVLRQLRQGLAKCYIIAFDSRANVSEATITSHTLNFVKKMVSTFGIGIENITSAAAATLPGGVAGMAGGAVGGVSAAGQAGAAGGAYSQSAANESLMRRAQASQQDPVFQKMKSEFTSNFDFTQPGSMKLQNLIHKLKKWIKILEAKTKVLPKSFLVRLYTRIVIVQPSFNKYNSVQVKACLSNNRASKTDIQFGMVDLWVIRTRA